MKNFKEKISAKWCAFLTVLLGLLGFAACQNNSENGGDEPCLYGCPHADFKFSGKITNEDGSGIQNLNVVIVPVYSGSENYGYYYADTVQTNSDGVFVFESSGVESAANYRIICFDSTGVYEKDSTDFAVKYTGGDGWYTGKAEKTDINFTLKKDCGKQIIIVEE